MARLTIQTCTLKNVIKSAVFTTGQVMDLTTYGQRSLGILNLSNMFEFSVGGMSDCSLNLGTEIN